MKTRRFFKRFISVVLVVSMMLAIMPTVFANTRAVQGSPYKLESDAATLNGWKSFFGADYFDTVNAGGVWTDKSVFTDASLLGALVGTDGNSVSVSAGENNFLVALSTIAANKSIVGYSHVPTDTILVLDVSGSMGPGSGSAYNDAVADMVTAANAAITSLQSLNKHNRVGVVLYSSNLNDDSPAILLPLGKYDTENEKTYNNGTPGNTSDDKVISVYLETNSDRDEVSIASDVYYYGTTTEVNVKTVEVVGGTYTQSGIDTAMDMFLKVDKNDTVISGNDFQSGTERKPVIVLMSDGDATYANTSYTNVPSSHNIGNGSDSTNNTRFLTQLTAAQAKARISEHYNDSEVLFYTLGLGGMSSILNPELASRSERNLWNSFANLDDDEYLNISNRAVRPSQYITSVDDMYYVTDSFEAESKADLYNTFEKIVNQIIIQSLYSPTNVSTTTDFDGFITFTDKLGSYMEVKDVKGILLGNTLFSGSHFAEIAMSGTGSLGTPDNATDLGNDFVWAVIQRMGLSSHPNYPTYAEQLAEARSLINLAYTHGQISYDSATGAFNNYIGWYADKDGRYIGFWDPEHTDDMVPEGAVYTNKCYGMLGAVKDGYRESDMLYITIQIHTEIDSSDQTVVFSIPSSLIPVVSYNVTLEGESLEDATDIQVEIDSAEPIRLLYEVGLRSDINALNISDKVGTNNKNADGTYTFYTNAYDAQVIKDSEDAEARGDESHIGEPGDNTFANFQPSLENERYYYNVNTAIYTLSGTSYIPYGASTAPKDFSGSLYRAYTHFKKNASDKWELYTDYAVINHDTLVSASRYTSGEESGNWYVPAGTIHHNLDSTEIKKANSSSVNDVEHSYYQFIHENVAHDSTYHIDTILGNNGKLTVTPETALKLSKTVDSSITDLDYMYYFIISGGTPGKLVRFVRESANGTINYSSYSFDRNGTTGVYVRAGESVYLTNIDEGSYTVTESYTASDNYHVKNISVNGSQVSGENVASVASVAVENQKVTKVEFTNTLGTGTPQESYLIITKTVTHDFGENYVVDSSKTFPIEIDLGVAYAGESVEINSTKQSATITTTADASGVITYDIAHGEHIALSVRVGTTVNVTEDLGNSYPGFNTPVISYTNGNLTGDAAKTIVADSNLTVGIVNDYDATAVNPVNVTLNVSKVLEGRDWLDTDAFTFQLQRYNPHDASYEVVGELKATKGDTELDFTSIIKAYDFDHIGEYHFRVIEIAGTAPIGGMTYDLVGRYFNVVVTDNLSGELVISDVQETSLTSVTLDNGVYNIEASDVVNVYAPAGDDEVFVNINKTVSIKDAPAGVTGNFTLSGFNFGLYDENGDLAADPFVTDASGNAQIKLMFSASSLNGAKKVSFYYTVKEIAPANDTTYNYDTTEYKIRIDVVDNLDGTVSAVLNIYDESVADYVAASAGNTASVGFVNEYVITGSVSKTLNIQKIMQNLGTKTHALNGFVFDLRDDASSLVDSFVSDNEGKASFTLEYDVTDIGKTYVYTLEERDTAIANMDYSDTVYTITASVTLTANNELSLEVTVNSGSTSVNGDLEFVNVYDEDIPAAGSDSVTITIDKSVSIKDAPAGVTGNLSPEGFEFILTDENGMEIGKYTVNANGEATITLTYNADEHVGNTYYYILKEIIPSDNLYEYDTTEYKFKVEVVDNRDGTISAKLSIYDNATQSYAATANDSYTAEFENKFIISGNATLDFTIVKKIDSTYGFTLSPEGFVFIMREASTGAEIGRLTTDASGRVTFSSDADISLIGASATVTIEELDDGRENVVYSTEKYTITVTVELDANNEVVIVPTITNSEGQPVSGTTLEFTNVYNYNEAPPTGDNTFLAGAGLALLAIIGGAVFFTRKRRVA